MLVQFFYFLAAMASVSLLRAQDDAWHLDDTYTLVNEELDPIVNPNGQASHMHKIIGGSKMAAYYNFAEYSTAKCSSLRVQADKSNYWMPNLYVVDKSDNTFTSVPAKIRFYYFLAKSTANEPVSSFPKGLRILVGNPNSKAASNVATFTCQINAQITNSLDGTNFNFARDCPYGMKTELFFPPCWDGLNLYKSDGSHMSYPSQGVRSGACPFTHPVRLPSIQLEYTWYTSQVNPGQALAGNLAWANGDTTGYGIHGDFVNGWDLSVLNRALNDSSCVGINKAITMSDCKTLNAYFDDAAAQACKPEKGTLVEPTGNADLVPIKALPGCNPLWSSGSKPTCSPAVAGLDVSAFKGTDGAYTADAADRKNFVLPTTPGWKQVACLHDISSLSGGVSYTDASLTIDSCQRNCLAAGYNYAGTGQQGTAWNCVCGSSISTTATVETGMCTTKCPGNSTQLCGGSYIFNIFYAPPGTTSTSTPRADGSAYIGCYSNPSTASNGLLGSSTYNFQSESMTTEVCIDACVGKSAKWALTTSQKYCYCGTAFNFGSGALVADSQCTTKCSGNSSEICGDYYKSSLYNITAVAANNATGNHPVGYQGCFQDKSGHLGLTNNSWASTAMTPQQCINGCSELGQTYAGVEQGNTCYCGTTLTSGAPVLPTSQCATACPGNSTFMCGGTQAMDLYTMTSATVTPASVKAKKPSGYIGCYKDSGTNLAYANAYSYSSNSMTVEVCKASCFELGYTFGGVEDGTQCKCGNNYPASQQMVSSLYCTKACGGNSTQTCGAGGYIEAYNLQGSDAGGGMPGISAANYVGCYSNSPAGLTTYSYNDNAMTVEVCRTACAGLGYSVGGVYNSKYCACANSWTGSTQKLPASQCQYYKCAGNSTEWCGGASQIALYNATGASTAVTKPDGWISCWTDSTTGRSLTGYQYSATPMSAKACRTACNLQGFSIAGTENGNQCFCGNSLVAGAKAPTSSCKTLCSGSTNETCGAGGFLDLYNATGAAANNGIAGYVGCYKDDSVLNGASYVSDFLSVDTCNQWCYARGSAYAGVRNGNQCKCGNTSPSTVTTLAACANPCSGNSAQNCGTSNTIAVYQLSATGIKSGDFVASSNSSGYVGCYKEGTTRMLPSYSFTSSVMTNDLCVSNCKSLGYALAGSEYAEQCYCANKLNSTSGGYKVQDSDCSTACKGGTGICGGGGLLSVWSTANTTVGSTTTAEGYKGCFSVGSILQSPPLTYYASYMTTQLCRRTCRFGGYSVAALTNANTCACASSATYGASAAPSTCNAPCQGNTTQTCGATYSSAVSVYDTTGAGAQTPSGFPDNYIGCISDASPHVLNNYTYTNAGMSSTQCRKSCVNLGYNNYGMENGNECYCSSITPKITLRPDSDCSTNCAGVSTEKCGAGGRISYFNVAGMVASASSATTSSASSAAASSSAASSAASAAAKVASSSAAASSSSSAAAASTSKAASSSAAAAASTSTSKAATSTAAAASSTSTSKAATSTAAAATSTSKPATSAAATSAAAASTSKAAKRSVEDRERDIRRIVHAPRGKRSDDEKKGRKRGVFLDW
ncbi:hypothetical protein IAT38_007999 [Cryptococcus sp. DSM 104549]